MSRWNEVISVVAWLTFVIVTAYPTSLEDNLFYGADFSIPEESGTSDDWSMLDSPLSLDENDEVTTYPVTLTEFDYMAYSGDELTKVDQWEDYVQTDFSGAPKEPVTADIPWTPYDPAATDPSDCPTNLGKRDTATDFTIADSEPRICPGPDSPEPQTPSGGIMPIFPPLIWAWECRAGLRPYCCLGGLQEDTKEAMECRAYHPFAHIYCNKLWTIPLCCKDVDKDGNGIRCEEPISPEGDPGVDDLYPSERLEFI
jgi:hypothetical protein